LTELSGNAPSSARGPAARANASQRWPADIPLERFLLGWVLSSPAHASGRLGGIEASVSPTDFFLARHQIVFRCLLEMKAAGIPLDLVALVERLEARGELIEAGGAAYVASLLDGVPAVADIRYHASVLRRKAALRSVAREAERISLGALEPGADPARLAAQLHELADLLLESTG
jgi:replicative DNA helicase